MKTKIFYTIVLAFAITNSPIQASELTQEFSNPSFSGIGQSNHYLATEQLQFQRKEEIRKNEERRLRDLERDEKNEVINKFIANGSTCKQMEAKLSKCKQL